MVYGRGRGVGGPSGLSPSKNNTCTAASGAVSPVPITTQCSRQSPVLPLSVTDHRSPTFCTAVVMVSALGVSSAGQSEVDCGAELGGLHPHEASTNVSAARAVTFRVSRKTVSLRSASGSPGPAFPSGCAQRTPREASDPWGFTICAG